MFTYVLLRGYRTGLLDRSCFYSGLQAFESLTETEYTVEDGLLNTLIGSGVNVNRSTYQRGRFVNNEAKGVAAFIMAAQFVR